MYKKLNTSSFTIVLIIETKLTLSQIVCNNVSDVRGEWEY